MLKWFPDKLLFGYFAKSIKSGLAWTCGCVAAYLSIQGAPACVKDCLTSEAVIIWLSGLVVAGIAMPVFTWLTRKIGDIKQSSKLF